MEALGSVVVQVRAELQPFKRGLDQAKQEAAAFDQRASRSFSTVDREVRSMNRAVADSAPHLRGMTSATLQARTAMLGFARAAAGAFVAGFSARKAQEFIDSATRIENALKVAGLSGEELTAVYDQLFESAQRNAAPIEALAQLYGRAALQQKELGVSTEELVRFTDNVALALRVAGTNATAASGALFQLGQALGSGTVRAEEFNSILEGATPIAQAVAAGLEEAGGSVAKLRSLVVDGKLSSEAFFRAFEAGAGILRERVADAEMTVSQSFIRLQNVLTDTAREFDETSGVSAELATMIDALAASIATTDFTPAIRGAVDFAEALVGVINNIREYSRAAGEAIGADTVGKFIKERLGARQEQDAVQSRIDAAFEGTEKGDRQPTDIGTIRPRRTVSLTDYAAPRSSGGSGKSAGGRADEYERLSRRIADSTAALVAETEAQRGLNPVIDDFGFAVEKARSEFDLLTSAQATGRAFTPALRNEISALAEQYGLAAAEAAKLREEQERVRDVVEFHKDLVRDAMSDLRSALSDGKLEWQELADVAVGALETISDRSGEDALDAIIQGEAA